MADGRPITEEHELKDKSYTVRFLIVRQVKVRAIDDIQAETKAFQRLRKPDRDYVYQMGVMDEADKSMGANEMHPPDMEWLQSHLIG